MRALAALVAAIVVGSLFVLPVAQGLLPALPSPAMSPPRLADTLMQADAHRAAKLAESALLPLAQGSGSATFARLVALAGVTPAALPAVPDAAWLADVPITLRPGLRVLAEGLGQAQLAQQAAFAGFSAADLVKLREASWPPPHGDSRLPPSLAPRALRLDLLAAGELALLRATEQAMPLLRGATSVPTHPSACATGAVAFATNDCTIVIGASGPNVYTRDVELLVDLGGADVYRDNAGGATVGAALLVDLGGSDDVYNATIGPNTSVQGAGSAGIGLLVDDGGNDTYAAWGSDTGEWGRIAAQGSGHTGAGVLWDQGGDDTYTARNAAQGVGLEGFGLLLDEGGKDHYSIPWTYDSEAGQGTGCWGGVGALLDRGTEPDTYDAYVDDLQGMGCAAGLGLLLDEGGNDAYRIHSGPGSYNGFRVIQSGWGQGYGEVGGAGIVLDLSGDDTYDVEVLDSSLPLPYEGDHAQGDGLLGGAGLLLDRSGDDAYRAQHWTQGAGDLGLGVLRDEGGNDSYAAAMLCQGAGNGGEGALLDLGGGRDHYDCGEVPVSGQRGDGQTWASYGGDGSDS